MGQVHAHDGVSGLKHREVGSHVRLCPAVRLDVDVLCPEELLAALAGQVLGHVHIFCAAVVTPPWIAFCVLVGHYAALSFHNCPTCVVLGCNQNEVISLPLHLSSDCGRDFGINDI